MTDGIGDLLKRKNAAKRPAPIPRNPIDRTKQATDAPTTTDVTNAETTPTPPTPIDSRRTSPRKSTDDTEGGRVKPAQFHIDETTEGHLAALVAAGKRAGVTVNNSLLVRRAIASVVAEHGYEGFVAWVAQGQQRRPGRPRLDG